MLVTRRVAGIPPLGTRLSQLRAISQLSINVLQAVEHAAVGGLRHGDVERAASSREQR